MKTLNKIHQDTPIMDIIVAKPERPKRDCFIIGYAINLIRCRREMEKELNKPIFKN